MGERTVFYVCPACQEELQVDVDGIEIRLSAPRLKAQNELAKHLGRHMGKAEAKGLAANVVSGAYNEEGE